MACSVGRCLSTFHHRRTRKLFFSWGLRLCQLWLALALLLGSYLPGSYSSSLSRPWIITDVKAWASRAVCNESLPFNVFNKSVQEAFNVDLQRSSSAQKVNVEGQCRRPTLRGADVARGRTRRYLQQDFVAREITIPQGSRLPSR